MGCTAELAACSFWNRREKSETAVFSFWRDGVVPCLVLARRPPDVYRMLRLRPNGPDSSTCRAFLAELNQGQRNVIKNLRN